MASFISGPIPPYSNPPIEPQYYQPSRFVISAITLGPTTTVTTTVNHNYTIGQACRLIIPPSFGCYQLNEKQGIVLSIPTANQVLLNINSSVNISPYIASAATTVAQILAIGDINLGNINASPVNSNTNVIGAFINISPN